jgi:hypothetical protein
MTRQRDFKALVRERMARTGERYSAARAQLLAKGAGHSAPSLPGILSGYDRFGGIQMGTAAVCNALRHASVNSPISNRPFSETWVNGVCGGPGFLYAVFEYRGWPPILSLALQSRSMPDAYVENGISRLNARTSTHETTSRAAARKALEEALANGRAAVCVVDIAALPWYGLPKEFIGSGPHVVTVAGRDGSSYWVDDWRARPIRIDAEVLADARAAYRKSRNRLITFEPAVNAVNGDFTRALTDAIADTARRYVEPAVPRSFWGNCGFSGLAKWRRLLVDTHDKRGWPTIFAEGPRAYTALQRAYEAIECQVAAGAGRTLYAQFLDEAAKVLNRPALSAAAGAFRRSARAWSGLAGVIAEADDTALRDGCLVADRRLELADSAASGARDSTELWERRMKLADGCRLSSEASRAIYARMASELDVIVEAETRAVEAMQSTA